MSALVNTLARAGFGIEARDALTLEELGVLRGAHVPLLSSAGERWTELSFSTDSSGIGFGASSPGGRARSSSFPKEP